MAKRTKFESTQIKSKSIGDEQLNDLTLITPTPTEQGKVGNVSHSEFAQWVANRLAWSSGLSSEFTAIQVKKTIYGGNDTTLGYSIWKANTQGWYFELFDENIDPNSIVEIIPQDADIDLLLAMNMKLRVESHCGYVKIFANTYPYTIENNRDLTVMLNIFKKKLKENEYLMEYIITDYSATGKTYYAQYVYRNSDDQLNDITGGIYPIPPQSSSRHNGIGHTNKYFIQYYDEDNKLEVSGNVQSIDINGTFFDTIISYNSTENYTTLQADTNPFPFTEPLFIEFETAIPVKIIFNE